MNKTPFADLNAINKKIALEQLEKGEIYPVTIVMDRYSGTYSNGVWLAFNLYPEDLPEEVGSSDPDEMIFWREHNDLTLPIGKGKSPEDALNDLKIKSKTFYESW